MIIYHNCFAVFSRKPEMRLTKFLKRENRIENNNTRKEGIVLKIVMLENRVLMATLHYYWKEIYWTSYMMYVSRILNDRYFNKIRSSFEQLQIKLIESLSSYMSPTSQYSSPFFPAMYSDLYIRKRVIIRMQLGQQIRTVADINKH